MEIKRAELEDLVNNFREKFIKKVSNDDVKSFLPNKPLEAILNGVNYNKIELSYLYMYKINNALDKKIEKSSSNAEEVYYGLPVYAKDLMGQLKKKSKNELLELIKEETTQSKDVSSLTKIIFKLTEDLKDYSRKELFEKEKTITNQLEEASDIFLQPKAKGEIKGALNSGMFGMTKGDLITDLRANGVKINKNDKLSLCMTDELIKYRIAGLYLTLRYCSKTSDLVFKRTAKGKGSQVNVDDYRYMLKKTKELGILIKKIYGSLYGKTPLEEMREEAYGGQITMQEVFPNRNI